MTDPIPIAADDPAIARRMNAIAAGLQDAGLTAQVQETRGVLDITAGLHRPGAKETEVTVDEDGYVEIRYWSLPGASAEQVIVVIVRALSAITAAQRA